MTPDLSVWMPSPDSGTSTRTVESAMRGDIELALPDADGLDEDAVEARGIEQVAHLARRRGQTAEGATASHRPDVDALVERHGFHADAVAEQRAAGEGAGGVHGHDRHPQAGLPVRGDEAFDESGFARAGRAGDADAPGAPDEPVDLGQQALEARAVRSRPPRSRGPARPYCRPAGPRAGGRDPWGKSRPRRGIEASAASAASSCRDGRLVGVERRRPRSRCAAPSWPSSG